MATMTDRVLEVIQTTPDVTTNDIVEFIGNVSQTSVASALTYLTRQRRVTRTPAKSSNGMPTFAYRYVDDPSKAPAPVIKSYRPRNGKPKKAAPAPKQDVIEVVANDVSRMSKASLRGRVTLLEHEVADLRAWKDEALRRHPDLAVSETVITAREIVAKLVAVNGNSSRAADVRAGREDNTLIMRATIEALGR